MNQKEKKRYKKYIERINKASALIVSLSQRAALPNKKCIEYLNSASANLMCCADEIKGTMLSIEDIRKGLQIRPIRDDYMDPVSKKT